MKRKEWKLDCAAVSVCERTFDTFMVCDYRAWRHRDPNRFMRRDVYRKTLIGDHWVLLRRQIMLPHTIRRTGYEKQL